MSMYCVVVDQIVVLDSIDLKDISEQEHSMEKDRLQALHIAEERWKRRMAEMDKRHIETEKSLQQQHKKTLNDIRHRKSTEATRHQHQLK
jgi:hypothetical protein